MTPSGQIPIAVVGLSARFAGCEDLKAFWLRVLTCKPALGQYMGRAAERYLAESPESFTNVASLAGGYLGDLWQVRSAYCQIPQSALPGTNPEFPLMTELAALAMKDSGAQNQSAPRERIGLFVGYSPMLDPATTGWCQHAVAVDQTMEIVRKCFPSGSPSDFESLKKSMVSALPQYDSRNISMLFHHTLATAIAERCDISGPVALLDAGSVSSHMAIRAACDSLILGRTDLALAGGAAGLVTPQLLMPFSRMGLISKSGRPRPFSKKADGTVLGEGGGFMVLKRYSEAVEAKDRIYAVIKACETAGGGSSKRIGGALQSAAKRAYGMAGPGPIELVEAGAIGNAAMDRAETKALSSVTEPAGPQKKESVALGSVKPLVGHCSGAAGIAGTIKAALALYHRIIPPMAEVEEPLDLFGSQETPFYFNPHPRPWIHNDMGPARRAAVSAFDMGGEASLLVLEQSP